MKKIIFWTFAILGTLVILIYVAGASNHLWQKWDPVEENIWKKDISSGPDQVLLINDCVIEKHRCVQIIIRPCPDTTTAWDMLTSTPDNDQIIGMGCKKTISFAKKEWRWKWLFIDVPTKQEWVHLPSTLSSKDGKNRL